jgi:hypothetical protein
MLSEVTADTALCTCAWASPIAASKAVLLTHPPDAEADVEGGRVAAGVEVDEDVLEHAASIIIESAAAIPQRCIARLCTVDPSGRNRRDGKTVALRRSASELNAGATRADGSPDMPNLYLIQKTDSTPDEVSADFYERQGDDWVFLLGGTEVARLEIESIVSIAKAPRDFG